jgi:heme-degrading monooxygenase HmoA
MSAMYISVTTSRPKPDQAVEVEEFLAKFLPRLERQPGVVAIYHYSRPDKGDDATLIIWESQDAARNYREGPLAKEAFAFEKALNLPGDREGYPLAYATSVSPLEKMQETRS